jgi:hypothetical protein
LWKFYYEASYITTIIPIAIGTVVLRPAQTDHSLVRPGIRMSKQGRVILNFVMPEKVKSFHATNAKKLRSRRHPVANAARNVLIERNVLTYFTQSAIKILVSCVPPLFRLLQNMIFLPS